MIELQCTCTHIDTVLACTHYRELQADYASLLVPQLKKREENDQRVFEFGTYESIPLEVTHLLIDLLL